MRERWTRGGSHPSIVKKLARNVGLPVVVNVSPGLRPALQQHTRGERLTANEVIVRLAEIGAAVVQQTIDGEQHGKLGRMAEVRFPRGTETELTIARRHLAAAMFGRSRALRLTTNGDND
jgi:hypothetical protein